MDTYSDAQSLKSKGIKRLIFSQRKIEHFHVFLFFLQIFKVLLVLGLYLLSSGLCQPKRGNKTYELYEGESISNQPISFLMDRDGHDFHALFNTYFIRGYKIARLSSHSLKRY